MKIVIIIINHQKSPIACNSPTLEYTIFKIMSKYTDWLNEKGTETLENSITAVDFIRVCEFSEIYL